MNNFSCLVEWILEVTDDLMRHRLERRLAFCTAFMLRYKLVLRLISLHCLFYCYTFFKVYRYTVTSFRERYGNKNVLWFPKKAIFIVFCL